MAVHGDTIAPIAGSGRSGPLLFQRWRRSGPQDQPQLNRPHAHSKPRLYPLGKERKPTGYILRRKYQTGSPYRSNFLQRHLPSEGFKEENVTRHQLTFVGQCVYLRQLHEQKIIPSILPSFHNLIGSKAINFTTISASCIDKLRVIITNVEYKLGNISVFANLFVGKTFKLLNNTFHFQKLSTKHKSSFIQKPISYIRFFPLKYSYLTFQLLLITSLPILLTLLFAQCYHSCRRSLVNPHLTALNRYSEDELPKFMRVEPEASSLGSARSLPNVCVNPMPVTYAILGSSKPDLYSGANTESGERLLSHLGGYQHKSENEVIYATVNKSLKSKQFDKGTSEQNLSYYEEGEKCINKPIDTASVLLLGAMTTHDGEQEFDNRPNGDYELVAPDEFSEDNSSLNHGHDDSSSINNGHDDSASLNLKHDWPPGIESPCLTRVTYSSTGFLLH